MIANTYPQNWFSQAKYGLFIHFGLYSLLAGEYKGKKSRGLAEWILNNADIPLDEYRTLAKDFNPVNFDAEAICKKAKAWGMRYVCLTSKHHDGFALYDSKVSAYNSVQASPCKRDFVKELAAACNKHDLVFCLYYSQAQDWDDPDGYRAYHDNSEKQFERYFYGKCLPQVKELLTNYGEVGMLWFDTPMGMSFEQSKELRDTVKSIQPNCLISGRIGHGQSDFLSTQDNRIPSKPIDKLWEVAGTMNDSWGYKYYDHNWQSAETVIHKLLRVVARGGNYLLNVGPDGTGQIPEACVKELDKAGKWLSQVKDSVYGTETLPLYVYEVPNYCFTYKKNKLFITFFNPNELKERSIDIPNIANNVKAAKWLNLNAENSQLAVQTANVKQTQTLEGDPCYIVYFPAEFSQEVALTLELTLSEDEYLQREL